MLVVLLNCKPAEVLINNCSFLHNKADISGAGIEILDGTYSTVVNTISINHTVFVGGSAGHTGGGISIIANRRWQFIISCANYFSNISNKFL